MNVTTLDINPTPITVTFPAMNKNDSIISNNKEILEAPESTTCFVSRIVYMNSASFNEWSNSLLSDYDFYIKCEWFEKDNKEGWTITKVINIDTNQFYYVDTQGSKYARYVGVAQ